MPPVNFYCDISRFLDSLPWELPLNIRAVHKGSVVEEQTLKQGFFNV
jgi:hypothetical protein